ncbi:MAG: hypothetical protein M0Z94_12430 [Dehalococcoidales bacterium]|nr:hypothetical protein [Dehalococcoidales bacterium]
MMRWLFLRGMGSRQGWTLFGVLSIPWLLMIGLLGSISLFQYLTWREIESQKSISRMQVGE